MRTDLAQVLIFIAAVTLFGYAYRNPESRERLATNPWHPTRVVALLFLAFCYFVIALNSFVQHRAWLIQTLFAVLFTVAGVWQLVLVRKQGQTRK